MRRPPPEEHDVQAAHHDTTRPPRFGTTHHTLSSGEPVLLRDVAPGDEERLLELLEHVTGDSRWFRFFTGGVDVRQAATMQARGDGDRRPGVLVLSGDGTTVLGHGMCVDAGGGEAEVAFEVADGHHRRGIGGIMLQHLLDRASSDGFTGVVAEVLPSNQDMLDLLAASGRELHSTTDGGVRSVRMTLSPGAGTRDAPSQAADPTPADLGRPGIRRSDPGLPDRPARSAR